MPESSVPLNKWRFQFPSGIRIPYLVTRAITAPAFPFFPPWLLARRLTYPGCGWDEAVTRANFRRQFRREIDLLDPVTFSEKINWLKLFHRRPIHKVLADKLASYDFVRGRGYGDVLMERYGVWENPEDVPLEELPETFVLKVSHGYRMNWFRRRGDPLPVRQIRREMRRWIRTDHSLRNGEWQYRGIARRILAEPLLQSPDGQLIEYRVFCFGGVPKFVRLVGAHDETGADAAHLDMDWRKLPFARNNQRELDIPARPAQFNRMIECAAALSADEPFLRVDFYEVEGRIIFSELTLHPDGGTLVITPPEWDIRLGSWIELPTKKI